MNNQKHKVFISYFHGNKECEGDEQYRIKFEKLFENLFINKSVQKGDIDADNSNEYIKRLIQSHYIEDSSVLVVLVGSYTWSRKHVDWEISAALNKKVGGYSGLLGIFLPNHPDYGKYKYNADIIPPRLVDNLKTGYAALYDWTEEMSKIKKWVDDAFQNRISKSNLINNSLPQYGRNKDC